ncbi:MAG: hypothetical protein HY650_01090 [Acidobacteria bacterium]|nr:hypothetical protein [Acidobacteriota bacterium]
MLRAERDADLMFSNLSRPSAEQTESQPHGLHCGMCGGLFYVDDETIGRVRSAIERGLSENPFCCEDCEAAYEDEEQEH